MLGEWITHLTTPCPQPFRKMGYLRELIAIEQRHRRCKGPWAPHLEACHAVIKATADNCPGKGKVVVLGSGLLLDIPLSYLAEIFDDVVLVDICHLRATGNQTRNTPNVRLLTSDISGVVRPLDHWFMGDKTAPLPLPEIDQSLVDGADYVISANLLAQLPLTPLAYLGRNAPMIDSHTQETFGRAIIDHHLSLLQSLDCPVTLISETLRLVSNGPQTLDKIDPLFGAPLLYEGDEWWWDIAPRPEIGRNFDVRLRILGIANLGDADQARYCRNTTLAAP